MSHNRIVLPALAVTLLALLAAGCVPSFGPPAQVTVIVTVVTTPTPGPTEAPAVTATAADAGTPVVLGTAAAGPTESVGATEAVQATAAAGATAEPVAQPTSTAPPATSTAQPTAAGKSTAGPSPTPCAIVPGGKLGEAWTVGTVRHELGCPTDFEVNLKTSYEPFEHGFMFWRDDTRHVYAVYEDGTWQEFSDTWDEAQPQYSCPDANTPAKSPPTPQRGFGKVWCTQPGVRAKLGNALSDEIGNNRTLQEFQNGTMIQFLENSDKPVVLFRTTRNWVQY